jgi:ribosomal subunit interface protein
MPFPIQIMFQNMDPSPAIEARVTESAKRLERFGNRIIGCTVAIEAPHRHHHKGKTYKVRVDLSVPGRDVHVTRSPDEHHAHEDVYVAIRDAFNAASRQLEDHVRRMRGDVKTHETPLQGKVVRLYGEEKYGYIENAEFGEVYFHANSVVNDAFETLTIGSPVRLSLAKEARPEGPRASTVTPIGKHHPAG